MVDHRYIQAGLTALAVTIVSLPPLAHAQTDGGALCASGGTMTALGIFSWALGVLFILAIIGALAALTVFLLRRSMLPPRSRMPA